MTLQELQAEIAKRGLAVDYVRDGAGKFRDYEIGTGAPVADLLGLVSVVKAAGLLASVQYVSNPDHEHQGKPYALVESFWSE